MKNKIIAFGIMLVVFLLPFKYAYLVDSTSKPIVGMLSFLFTLFGIFISMFVYDRGSVTKD